MQYEEQNNFSVIFSIPDELPPPLAYITIIYRLLYDLTLDLFDKPNVNSSIFSIKSPPLSRESSVQVYISMFVNYLVSF